VDWFAAEIYSWKSAIAFSMSLILAIMLYPQILNMAPPEYKVGSIISQDIQADRDFLVVDKAATELKKGGGHRKTQGPSMIMTATYQQKIRCGHVKGIPIHERK